MGDLASCPLPSTADRGKDLLNQPDLSVSSGPEWAKVPGFDAVCRQRTGCAGNRPRGVAVVTAGGGVPQSDRGEGLASGLVQVRCLT